jgi:hypothetical protein
MRNRITYFFIILIIFTLPGCLKNDTQKYIDENKAILLPSAEKKSMPSPANKAKEKLNQKDNNSNKEINKETKKESLIITDKVENGGHYPEISGLENKTIQNKINQKIKWSLLGNERIENREYKVMNITNDILSIMYMETIDKDSKVYTGGHLNFNLKNGKELKLSDLFEKDTKYKEKINVYINQLKNKTSNYSTFSRDKESGYVVEDYVKTDELETYFSVNNNYICFFASNMTKAMNGIGEQIISIPISEVKKDTTKLIITDQSIPNIINMSEEKFKLTYGLPIGLNYTNTTNEVLCSLTYNNNYIVSFNTETNNIKCIEILDKATSLHGLAIGDSIEKMEKTLGTPYKKKNFDLGIKYIYYKEGYLIEYETQNEIDEGNKIIKMYVIKN